MAVELAGAVVEMAEGQDKGRQARKTTALPIYNVSIDFPRQRLRQHSGLRKPLGLH